MVEKKKFEGNFKAVEIPTDSRTAIIDKDNNEYPLEVFLVMIKNDLDELKGALL